MSFLELLDEDHFASRAVLPRGGEEWADLFQINTARKPPTMSCPTGCLPLFVPDASHRHGLSSPSAVPQAPTPTAAPTAAAPTPTAAPKPSEQPKKKKSRQSTQVYQTSGPELDQPPVTTRSGRLSKRPQNILILEDDLDESATAAAAGV